MVDRTLKSNYYYYWHSVFETVGLLMRLSVGLTVYWVVQAGLLTSLTFTSHRLSPLAVFISGVLLLSSQWNAVTVNSRSLQC